MQFKNAVERDIEHLLAELVYCLNALRQFREQWTLNDIQQVELILADFKQHVPAYH
ncbi:Uncharacterised protein [Legionella busanensis]|uniref:Uncharacterized protein n=1 Tax=Legionella busanensis TaxID=190655 RepID=A0A378JJI3_9GAMM|nr:hypothetical protein [Legionella busanensis]STX50911.1 Uncharacterised protein [Legionella busanensis]